MSTHYVIELKITEVNKPDPPRPGHQPIDPKRVVEEISHIPCRATSRRAAYQKLIRLTEADLGEEAASE